MKLLILSDIHSEFHNDRIPQFDINSDCDIVVLAGDIASHHSIFNVLIKLQSLYNKPLIFIPGNHEYYGVSISDLNHRFSTFQHKDIHILNNYSIKIEKYTFIGSTGWFDGSSQPITNETKRKINDFYKIQELKYNLYSPYHNGNISRNYIEQNNNIPNSIIITHHLPSTSLISEQYKYSDINGCFANDWDCLFNDNMLAWIHGHSHDSINTKINNIPCVRNPLGYPTSRFGATENFNFNPHFILDL